MNEHNAAAHHNHILSPKVYLAVFAALMVGTWLTVWVAGIDLGALNLAVAMTIAVAKATLVVLYFMHLRYSERLNWVFAGAALFWLALLIGLVMADFIAQGFEGGLPGEQILP